MLRQLIRIGTVTAVILAIAIPLHPVHSKLRILAFLGCIVAGWTGLTFLSSKRKPWIIAALGSATLVTLLFLLPGRAIDANELREDYLRRVKNFEGTQYVWGGENARGIDCSGLPRRALQGALFSYDMAFTSSSTPATDTGFRPTRNADPSSPCTAKTITTSGSKHPSPSTAGSS